MKEKLWPAVKKCGTLIKEKTLTAARVCQGAVKRFGKRIKHSFLPFIGRKCLRGAEMCFLVLAACFFGAKKGLLFLKDKCRGAAQKALPVLKEKCLRLKNEHLPRLFGWCKSAAKNFLPAVKTKGPLLAKKCLSFLKEKLLLVREKYMLVALIGFVLFLSLVPLLWIAVYNHPGSDDFSFSAAVAHVSGDGFFACLAAACEQVKRYYFGWQGTYSAVFMMSLSPSAFSEGLYVMVPYVLLFLFVFATVSIFRVFLGRLFGAEASEWLPPALIAVFLSVHFLPSLVQGFYWYNGAVYYCFYYSLALLDFCLMVHYLNKGKKRTLGLGLFLAAFVGGGNYVTALTLTLMLLLMVVMAFISKTPRKWGLLVHLLVFLAGFIVSIAAPGNAVRQAQFPDSPGVFETILESFELAFFYLKEWWSLPLTFGLLFTLPFFGRIAKRSTFRFPLPLLVTLFSFCFFAAGFAPPVFAMGYPGDGRLWNILWFSFVLLLLLNVFYWVGWVQRAFAKKGGLPKEQVLMPLALLSFCLCILFTVTTSDASVNIALSSLKNGEAQAYHQEMKSRLTLYKDKRLQNIVVEPLSVRPRALVFEDITADPENWKNDALCNYYQKESIRLSEDYPDTE